MFNLLILLTKGDKESALADYNKAIQLNPKCVWAYEQCGQIYETLSNYDQAIAIYTQVLLFSPGSPRDYFNRGMAYLNKREFEKAIEIYSKYAGAWFELGRLRERGEQMEEARYAYAQSIAADPKFLNPYERLYLLAFKQSKWKDVAENSDRVLHLDPVDYPGAYYYNAIAYLQLGNLGVAEKSARQSVALDTRGTNPQSMYVLGVILARKRDFSGAASWYVEG